jgi:protein involved in polysaccharide export with SLBB domain
MRAIQFVVLLIGIAASASAVVAQSTGTPTPDDAPPLQVGDAIRVTVWGNLSPGLGGTFEIGEDGTVIHPIYQSIHAVGASHRQVEAEVRRVLQRYEVNPEFVMEPLYRVWITGEVRNPGMHTVTRHNSIAHAVAQAGGPTPLARLSEVRVLREGGEMVLDLNRPYSEIAHHRVRSGDQIIVGRRDNLWRDHVRPVITTASSVASLTWAFFRLYRYFSR